MQGEIVLACSCYPNGRCQCEERGGYYATKVMRPETPARRASTVLEDRLARFSVPELRQIMQEYDIPGRGRADKDQMIQRLGDTFRNEGAPLLIIQEYEDQFGRGD